MFFLGGSVGAVQFLLESAMGLIKKYMNQTRKPEGKLGSMMIKGMNIGHATMADWGMGFLDATVDPSNIIDFGCGGGRNLFTLLNKFPNAYGTGVDYSELSVQKSKEFNKALIDGGRCDVQQGDVSDLKLEKDSYDLATAFETIYFWPGLERCFAQVAGTLKSGSTFMIVNESDGTDSASKKYEKIIEGMKIYTEDQIAAALRKAGFCDIRVKHHHSKPWITVLATKA